MPLCRHGSQEAELTANPAPWLKTIKSKVEIGRSLAVTHYSGTYMGDCKFPLLPCYSLPQHTHSRAGGVGGWVCVRVCVSHKQHMHMLLIHEDISEKAWAVGVELWSGANWRQHWEFFCLMLPHFQTVLTILNHCPQSLSWHVFCYLRNVNEYSISFSQLPNKATCFLCFGCGPFRYTLHCSESSQWLACNSQLQTDRIHCRICMV